MKKLLISLLLGVSLFSVGCGKEVDYEENKRILDKAENQLIGMCYDYGFNPITEDLESYRIPYKNKLYDLQEDIKGLEFDTEEYQRKYSLINYIIDSGINGMCLCKENQEYGLCGNREHYCDNQIFMLGDEMLTGEYDLIVDEEIEVRHYYPEDQKIVDSGITYYTRDLPPSDIKKIKEGEKLTVEIGVKSPYTAIGYLYKIK